MFDAAEERGYLVICTCILGVIAKDLFTDKDTMFAGFNLPARGRSSSICLLQVVYDFTVGSAD